MECFQFNEGEKTFRENLRRLAGEKIKPLAEEYGETDDVPSEIVEAMATANLFRILFPKEYGGEDISAVKVCIAREELSKVSCIADVTLAMQGLGGYPIVLAGTEHQKKKYLPKLAAGELLSTYALTEPEAGSDVAGLDSTAVRDGDHYVLNGTKRFISNGYRADMGIVFAKTDMALGNKGISAFIYEKGIKGLTVLKRIKLTAPHDIVELSFEDCFIPAVNILGAENDGFKIAMATLDMFRMSVGAAAVGMGQAGLDAALQFSLKRKTFGEAIYRHQAISLKLAEMAMELDAARLLVYRAADLKDKGVKRVSKESAMAKCYATEAAFRIIDQAVQIHGGLGVVQGTEVERLYREARAPRIYEGTTEIQKLIISHSLIQEAKTRDG